MDEVIVYSKPNCIQCDKTKMLLTRRGIPFEEREITTELAEEFKAQGLMSAPVVKTLSGKVWAGFKPDQISALTPRQEAAA